MTLQSSVFVTKQFIEDVESLNKSLREQFAKKVPIFCTNPHDTRLSTEKLYAQAGKAEIYSCRLTKAYRFIRTNELSPCPTLRLVGPHDVTYRRAEKMSALQQEKVRPLQEASRVRASAGKFLKV